MGWFDKIQDVGEAALSTGAAFATDHLQDAKGIPYVGNVISGAQGVYHTGAAVYDGVTGDRDGAISHGVQAAMGLAGAHPAVSAALGTADKVLGVGGTAARGVASIPGSPVKPGDIPTSVTDILASSAVQATNTVFGADDSNWIAPGDKATGTRQGEINAGTGMMANTALNMLGPLGSVANLFGADKAVGDTVGNFFGDTFGSADRNKPGTTSGVEASGAAKAGQYNHNLIKQGANAVSDFMQNGPAPANGNPTPGVPSTPGSGGGAAAGPGGGSQGVGPTSDGAPHGGMPIPLRPDGSTPGHGAAYGPNGGSSFSQGPGSHGSPGKPLGPADAQGTIGPENQLIGPGGLLKPPPAAPAGPMPHGVSPKGNGAPMSGPMPQMPWFLQPAGPSTW